MSTYQLRFPQGSSLWNLPERLIAEIWHVLSLHTEWKDGSDDHCLQLSYQVHRFLNRYIKSFMVCGEWERCHTHLVSTPWSTAPPGVDDRASKGHQILLLEMEEDME